MTMLRNSLVLAVVIIAALGVLPRPAMAAPFCVQVTGMTPQCIYFDPTECRKYAASINALCKANPAELKILPGDQRYCLVTGNRAALCSYPDYQSCDKVAEREGDAVCVDNGPPQTQQDPYRTEPGYRY